eukprot:scaffold1839_cov382-Prasinococcus_capsulatus_cf.AAC.7
MLGVRDLCVQEGLWRPQRAAPFGLPNLVQRHQMLDVLPATTAAASAAAVAAATARPASTTALSPHPPGAARSYT